MADLMFAPEIRLSNDIQRQVSDLAETRMLAPARRAGYDLALLGITSLPQEVKIQTDRGNWWFTDHRNDPTAAEYNGRIPIPRGHLAWLTEMDRYGLSPSLIWTAHQLPDSYREGDPTPRLVPPPRHLREKDEHLTLRLTQFCTLFLAGAAGLVAGAAALPLALIGVGLDPIIFGGVKHPELPIVAWTVLCSWEWE